MNGSNDECAALQAELNDLNSEIADLLGILEILQVEQQARPSQIRVVLRRIRELLGKARHVESRLNECRRAQAADGARLDELKLTQSGMVTRPVPPMPLVAGKTTLLRGTARITNPRARITAAWLDVVREQIGAVVGSVRGYAIGSDNHSLSEEILPGEHVHFFIPRWMVAAEGTYRLQWHLEVGGSTHTGIAFSGLEYRENAGVPMVAISFDEGLFTPSFREGFGAGVAAVLVFIDHLSHTARIFPVKDTAGSLASSIAGYGGRDGIRFDFLDGMPLPEQGSLQNYEKEFVLWDMMVGNQVWNGRFLTFNFTVPEDLNRNTIFDSDELAKLQPPQGGGRAPILNRIENFGRTIVQELQDRRTLVRNTLSTEWPEYGMAFVTGTDDLQNRTGWLGYAAGWCTIWPNLGLEEQYPVFAQELAHQWQGQHSRSSNLPPPAYDLLGKRRVTDPKDVMADPIGKPLRDSFLNDSDYDLVHTGIFDRIPRSARNTSASRSGLRLFVAGALEGDERLELSAVRRYTAAGLRKAENEDLIVRLLDENDQEIGRGAVGFVTPPKVKYRHPPPTAADRQVFCGEILFDQRARAVVIERQDRELRRLKVPTEDPTVVFPGSTPSFDKDAVDLEWDASDPNDYPLSYDISLFYPLTGRTVLLAGNLRQPRLRVRTAALLPGGEDVELHIAATNGFTRDETKITGLRLPDRPPWVTLFSPTDGGTIVSGALIALSAAAWDPQDGSRPSDELRWTSDRDGDLGRGTEIMVRLSPGTHVITAEVLGRGGQRGFARAKVVVQ